MEKTDIINKITGRLDNLEGIIEERLKKLIKVPVKKKGKKSEVDEEVCPVCGGDLLFVEEGIVFCNKCVEYYETANEEEEED